MNLKAPLPPPSNEKLEWFEDAYQVRLPEAYKEFLKHGNGAVPTNNLFSQNGRERVLERFLCILEDPLEEPVNGVYDITVVITQVDERLVDDEDMVGHNVIPIAALFAGDLLCLDYRHSATSPSVSVWDHEASTALKPHLETVAQSFEGFMADLYSTS